MTSPRSTETEIMTITEDRDSVYNNADVPVWTPERFSAAPETHSKAKLSPRAKAGIAASGVVLAATGMFAWSQYETAQANADVQKAQIALQQEQLSLQLAQQQAQAAKTNGQETPAQVARRQALEKCITAAGTSYNGVQDCANAYPAIDSTGALTDAAPTASSTPTSDGASSPVGLIVLAGVGGVVAVGAVKKRFARS